MSDNRDLRGIRLASQDVETLVSLVGRTGAIHALACSDVILGAQLREFGTSLGLSIGKRVPKKAMAEQIVRHVDRRISRTLEELQSMDRQAITDYLTHVECDSEEIIQLLGQIDLKAQARKSRGALIEFAAMQISSLGVFLRLSENKHHASQHGSEADDS